MLWELRKTTGASDGDLVFTADTGGRIDQKNFAARVVKPACVGAGLGEVIDDTPTSWVTLHTFRHTCLTQLFRSGWNAAQVSRFAGNSDAGFTLRTYVHLLDENLPTPAVLDSLEGGNKGATEATETSRTDVGAELVEIAV